VAITAVAVAVTRRAPRVTRLARPRPRVGVAAAYLAGTGHEQRDRAALEPAATSRRVTGLGRSAAPGALVRNLAGPRGRTVSMVTARRVHRLRAPRVPVVSPAVTDRKSTRLNSSHVKISYAVFCLKKKKSNIKHPAV